MKRYSELPENTLRSDLKQLADRVCTAILPLSASSPYNDYRRLNLTADVEQLGQKASIVDAFVRALQEPFDEALGVVDLSDRIRTLPCASDQGFFEYAEGVTAAVRCHLYWDRQSLTTLISVDCLVAVGEATSITVAG